MIHAETSSETDLPKPILPNWVMDSSAAVTLENAGFASGSALALLHSVLHDPNIAVPSKLLRGKLALHTAVHCLKFERRNETEAALLDAYLLTHEGDARGPAGDMMVLWSKACSVSIRNCSWQDRIIGLLPDHLREFAPEWLDFDWYGSQVCSPVAAAAKTLTRVLKEFPREEAIALLFADITLSHCLRWLHPFPFMAQHLLRKHLQGDEGELLLNCHLSVATSAQNAIRAAHDLGRRAARLRSVAPKLRSKGSDEAVELFLSEIAISPASMLSPTIQGTNIAMTSRSARRLCDRLVDLGVARELTGRPTFRLYGI